jgi:hypothetical protein
MPKLLFPDTVRCVELTPELLGWMFRGLQRAGVYALEMKAIVPYTLSFCREFREFQRTRDRDSELIDNSELDSIASSAQEAAWSVYDAFSRKRKWDFEEE